MAANRYRLKSLTIAAFKCFIDTTVVDFDGRPGLKFLTGRNEVEPRLGANGAGKTSLWDALYYCLYGVSALGDKASDLVAWGYRRPEVTAVFTCDGEDYRITRLGCPDRLTINDQLITQADLDGFMGLSRARFAQSVIFGQRVAFFLDLSIPARGALLDEALDLSLWNRAADKAQLGYDSCRLEITQLQQELAFEQGRLSGLPDALLLRRQADEWTQARDAEIEQALADLAARETAYAALCAGLARLRADHAASIRPDMGIAGHKLIGDEIHDKRLELERKRDALADLQDQMRFLDQGLASCPTCRQPIPDHYAKARRHELECAHIDQSIGFQEAADAAHQAQATHDRRARADALAAQALRRLEDEVMQTEARVEAAAAAIERDMVGIERMLQARDANPFAFHMAILDQDRVAIRALIDQQESRITAAQGRLLQYDYWRAGFKRVRLFIVQRVMLQLGLETANAASLLGIADWVITFVTETETKSGGLRQGVQVQIQSPASPGTLALPSGGEGQRLRLAVEMGLAGLLQRMAGVSYDFEVWDEPSGYLSDEGIDDLLDCLRHRAQLTGKAVWLTDHRTYAYNFDQVWTAVKQAGGSIIDTGEQHG